MHNLELKNITSAFDNYDVLLFDLWGVIIEGDYVYPGVVDAINSISPDKQVYFVSNAPRPIASSFEIIKSWGIKTSIDKVVTSGEIARRLIINSKKDLNIDAPVVYHLGADRNTDILSGIDIEITSDITKANILLLSLYRDLGEDLNEFDSLLEQASKLDITYICANPDIIIKRLGSFRYNGGYFAKKLEAFGKDVLYTGKPFQEIYDIVFSRLHNVPKDRILMIGDTMETDILGASRAGIHSALVMTGNMEKVHAHLKTTEEKLSALRAAAIKSNLAPNFVVSLV